MTDMSEWEEKVRKARKELGECETPVDVRATFLANASLGWKTLGRCLVYSDAQFERMIERRES